MKKKRTIGLKYLLTAILLACQCANVMGGIYLNACYASEIPEENVEDEEDEGSANIDVTDIDLGDYQKVMKVGGNQLLFVTPIPINATNQTINYSSSNESIATINGLGRITAVSEGYTTISVVCGSVIRSFQLSVEKEKVITASEIDMGDYKAEMTEGDKQNIYASIFPSNASNLTIIYSSSNTKVATINSMGRITALKTGTTIISAKCSGASTSFELIVKEKIKAKEIDLGDFQEKMKVKDKQMLGATVIPTNAVDQTITYSSSNDYVATVNSLGRITALSVGTAIITVKCGVAEKSFVLTIKEEDIKYVTDIELGNYEKEIYIDKTQTLSATALPATAENGAIKYSSSDPSIATVLSNGEIKGISKGKVIISIKAGDVTKEIEITVKASTKKIELNSTYLVLKKGDTIKLNAKAMPMDAEQEITYRAVDASIADVTPEGKIIAEDVGNTFIIVSNGDISKAVTVIVNKVGTVSREADIVEIINDDEVAYADLSDKDKELILGMKYHDELLVEAREYKLVSKEILKKLLETSSKLTIKGENYSMTVNGSEIINFENKLETNIELIKKANGLSFVLNNGNNLPCSVAVSFEGEAIEGRFVYLYNEKKEKYQLLETNNIKNMVLDEAGEYLLTIEKISKFKLSIVLLMIAGGVAAIIGIIFILMKKKYWFY
ncbi:MAG: hypothetical protein CVU84_07450 [Firmicutes bacterium HGW-Firmicutes-1]|jgi:uncharacterized protein YjdB|nr:MAG: hypothetical protein CVU84_07450 [Firmicutes bacterium HGW-Firmicutes-1]